jgi:hypothetical protein
MDWAISLLKRLQEIRRTNESKLRVVNLLLSAEASIQPEHREMVVR